MGKITVKRLPLVSLSLFKRILKLENKRPKGLLLYKKIKKERIKHGKN
jgi:hypothetical protein